MTTSESAARAVAFNDLRSMPDRIVVEPAFIVSALDRSVPGHDSAAMFLQQLQTAGTLLCFNELLELQLHDVAFGVPADPVCAQTRGAYDARLFLGLWAELLRSTDVSCIDLRDVTDDVMYFMDRAGLSASAAVHAATTMLVEADGLVVADPRYGAVDGSLLRLYSDERVISAVQRFRDATP